MKTINNFMAGKLHIFIILLFSIFMANSGGGIFQAASAADLEYTGDENILGKIPQEMPKNYSEEEISTMLEDIQEVDDSADTEGMEDGEEPPLSDADRVLAESIMDNPDAYTEKIQSIVWLNAHPWVVWYICSDYGWIDAHPRFGARIYLNYNFWYRYPKIAFIIMRNRPFLIRYPRIPLVIYKHDAWFIKHPYVAREIYRHHAFFTRYPDFFNRYYRHTNWIKQHPGVARIAYEDRAVFKKHPLHLGHAYDFRRHAVERRIVREPHVIKMRERLYKEHDSPRPDTIRPHEKQPDRPVDKNRDKKRGYEKRQGPEQERRIEQKRGPEQQRKIEQKRNPNQQRKIEQKRGPEQQRNVEQKRGPEPQRNVEEKRTIERGGEKAGRPAERQEGRHERKKP